MLIAPNAAIVPATGRPTAKPAASGITTPLAATMAASGDSPDRSTRIAAVAVATGPVRAAVRGPRPGRRYPAAAAALRWLFISFL